jgi:hypothetical protein
LNQLVQHVQALVDSPVNFHQPLKRDFTLALSLIKVHVQQMTVVGQGVVPVLVQSAKQPLEALFHLVDLQFRQEKIHQHSIASEVRIQEIM